MLQNIIKRTNSSLQPCTFFRSPERFIGPYDILYSMAEMLHMGPKTWAFGFREEYLISIWLEIT